MTFAKIVSSWKDDHKQKIVLNKSEKVSNIFGFKQNLWKKFHFCKYFVEGNKIVKGDLSQISVYIKVLKILFKRQLLMIDSMPEYTLYGIYEFKSSLQYEQGFREKSYFTKRQESVQTNYFVFFKYGKRSFIG